MATVTLSVPSAPFDALPNEKDAKFKDTDLLVYEANPVTLSNVTVAVPLLIRYPVALL